MRSATIVRIQPIKGPVCRAREEAMMIVECPRCGGPTGILDLRAGGQYRKDGLICVDCADHPDEPEYVVKDGMVLVTPTGARKYRARGADRVRLEELAAARETDRIRNAIGRRVVV